MKEKVIKTSNFREQIYNALKKVPEGKVTTYKALAEQVGCRGYQAVGTAMNQNPFAPVVPCHRVIKANGEVGGFLHGTNKKMEMLKKEGIEIDNGKINLEKFEYKFQ